MMPRQTLSRTILSLMGALVMLGGFVVLGSLLPVRSVTVPQREFPPAFSLNDSATAAKAAIVYDPTEGRILFAKNASQSLPLASITKLMAAQALLAEYPDNTLVSVGQGALRVEGSRDLKVGEVWSLHDLLMLGLVASSNEAMAAAAESSGDIIAAMNRSASRLGLTQTYFLNPTGLDVNAEVAGAYGSAHDIAILASTFMKEHPEFFEASTRGSVSITGNGRTITASSTVLPLQGTSGLIGAKTGFTDLAGGNLVVAFDIVLGHPLIAVVLGSTRDGRFEDIDTLVNAARAAAQQP